MDIRTTQLQPDKYYHIFNRGINGNPVFFENRNYNYFLQQYATYTFPFVETYAYCLLNNHFHLLIRVRSEDELKNAISKYPDRPLHWHVSNGFSSFIQGYTRGINKTYSRTDPLFENPFKRIEVTHDAYFSALVAYIHRNPEKHGFVNDFRDYPHSSYHAHLHEKQTKLNRKEVLEWFGDTKKYEAFHASDKSSVLSEDCLRE